ncbi:MAG: hypothetical protein OXG09_01970 [Chloroflexi bacterium]|nr:hypothetical protein [Chloroflexota bacterium]
MLRYMILSLLLVLGTAVSAQESETKLLDFEVTTGILLSFLIDEVGSGLYLVEGEKVERPFRSDYYLTEGVFDIEVGDWLIVAIGLGGDDRTFYSTDDFNYEASPLQCVKEIGYPWSNSALEVTCSAQLEWSVQTGFPIAFLLVVRF